MNHDTTQMDFVASAMREPTLTQSSFLDANGKVNLKSDPTYHQVDKEEKSRYKNNVLKLQI